MKRFLKRSYSFLLALLITFFASVSFAGSFQMLEVSGTSTGDFHAGGAADISNVSLEFFNPAILVAIHHEQISLGATAIMAQSDFNGTVQGGTTFPFLPTPPIFHTPPGGIVTSAGNVIPNFHYVLPFQNNRLAFGFGANSAYGLETNYGGLPISFSGITQAATFSQLLTLNLNPSLAWLITKHIAIAAGFDLVYGDAHYNNMIIPQGAPVSAALSFKNNLDGYGHGYNVGILFLITPRTRIGASYRSKVTLNLGGQSTLTTTPDTEATARLPLPPLAAFSIFHQFTKRFSLMFSAYWTGWHVFNTLRLKNSALINLLGPGYVLIINENYRDAWLYSVGMHYLVNRKMLFKMGLAYDETPIRTGFRDIRLPDSNRVYIAGGIHIFASKKTGLDLSYVHVFFTRADVDSSQLSANSASGGFGPAIPTVLGTSKSSANVVAFQFTYNLT